ncbi:hypothetical protein SMICM17S_00623 [Streptomyces microflavus]
MTAWALVPLAPSDVTAARRLPPSGTAHRLGSVCTKNGLPANVTLEFVSVWWGRPGSTSCLIASSVLMTPITPAAACAWPMEALVEPSEQNRSASVKPRNARSSARNSTGSPSLVPVPCASTNPIPAGSMAKS